MTFLLVAIAVLASGCIGAIAHDVREKRRGTPALPPPPVHHNGTPREPARDRSLDASSRPCEHSSRPAAVVPHTYTAPVAWVCPDCDAVVPTPPPLGPAPDPEPRGPGARSNRTTAASLSGTVRAGSTTIKANAITAGTIRAESVTLGPTAAPQDHLDVLRTRMRDVVARFDQIVARCDFDNGTVTIDAYDAYRTALAEANAALLLHAGHTPNEVRAAMHEWDIRQTTAAPNRVNTGLGRGWPIDPTDDTRPL